MVRVAFLALFILAPFTVGSASYATEDGLQAKIAELKLRALGQEAHIRQLEVLPSNSSRRLESPSNIDDPITEKNLVSQPFSIYDNQTTAEWKAWSQAESQNQAWLVLCGALVFLMQAGFMFREAGFCRFKHVEASLLKNLANACIGTIAWWICGYTWAFAGPYFADSYRNHRIFKEGWLGYDSFAGHGFVNTRDDQQDPTTRMGFWFYQWAACLTASAIVSGAIAERTHFTGYAIFTTLMSGFIYPAVAAWTQGAGWLSELLETGFFDYAGSGVIHMAGGTAALFGAIIAGARKDRFAGKSPMERVRIEDDDQWMPHSQPLIMFGTLLLWIGWYGLNCGATLGMSDFEAGAKAAHIAMTTTIAAGAGGLTAYFFRLALWRSYYDIDGVCNGILAGLVSIAAACSTVEVGTAAGIGVVGGLLFCLTSALLRLLAVDDPVDAFAVHGITGAWGVFAAALMDWGTGLGYFSGWSGFRCLVNRNTQGCKGEVDSLAKHIVAANMSEIFSILGWVGAWAIVLFLILKCAKVLRISDEDDEKGQDMTYYAPTKAYDPYNDIHWQREEADELQDYI